MSRYESILSQLYEILGPYTPDGQSLSEDTEFIFRSGLDSMKVMQLLLDTEERVRRFHSLEHHPGRADRRRTCPVRPATH